MDPVAAGAAAVDIKAEISDVFKDSLHRPYLPVPTLGRTFFKCYKILFGKDTLSSIFQKMSCELFFGK